MRFKLNIRNSLLIIASIFTIQFLIFSTDHLYKNNENNRYYQKIIAERIITLVQKLQSTPLKSQNTLLNKSSIPHAHLTLDSYPAFNEKITSQSLWEIYRKLKTNDSHIELSIQLSKNNWLNILIDVLPPVSNTEKIIFILSIFMLPCVFLLLYLVDRFALSLHQIKNVTHQLGQDLNTASTKSHGSMLARHVIDDIAHLQKRIQQLIQERTLMIAAISHDLLTPMTRLRLRSDFIQDQEQQHQHMKDLDEMEAMIKETLLFATEDYQLHPKNKIDLATLLISLCHDYQDHGHTIQYQGVEKNILTFGSLLHLKRAFTNLIENAIKYGRFANIEWSLINDEVLIQITDNGPGLKKEELEKVLIPFYRSNQINENSKGTGLGLTIANNIIQAHHGNLTLQTHVNDGLCVIIQLPVYKI